LTALSNWVKLTTKNVFAKTFFIGSGEAELASCTKKIVGFYEVKTLSRRRCKMFKNCIALIFSLGIVLILGTGVYASQPKVFLGVAEQYMDQLNTPSAWDYVRKNADGLYVNNFLLDKEYTQPILNSYAALFTNKNAYIESDMGSTLVKEQGYINRTQAAGFKVSYTSLNYGWDATRAANLKNYALPSGQSPRLNLVQAGPWTLGGNITTNGGNASFTNAQYRSWIGQADGDSTDGPMGLWYTDSGQMKAGSYSMVNYAHSLGKTSFVMLAPYHAYQTGYDESKFLATGKSSVREHEDNNAEPDIWGIFAYASTLPGTPETNAGTPANTVTGMAYYLLKHIKGDPNTLDISATDDSNTVTGQGIYSPTNILSETASFNPNVAAGTVYHYRINLTNNSTWLDYAGHLKARLTGATAAWNVQFKLGSSDVTSDVVSTSGYKFYQGNRLNPTTTHTVDLYLTRTSSTGSADIAVDMSLLAHDGSAVMDSVRVAGVGSNGITSGTTYKLINVNSGKALDVFGGGTAVGTNVDIWTDNNSAAQQWRVIANSDGSYKLINPHSSKDLDVANAGTADGTNVQISGDNGSGAQKWQMNLNGDGSYTLINVGSGKALDVSEAGTADGTNVRIWTSNGTSAQKWQLVPISSIVSGATYKLINVNSGKALDVTGAGTAVGTNVEIYTDNNTAAQRWQVILNSDGSYKLINPNSDKTLDVANAGTADGTNVQISGDNGSGAQKWQMNYNSDGSYTLINIGSGKALDVSEAGTANGTNVRIWTSNGSDAQKWQLILL
jgi:hypothetical protein